MRTTLTISDDLALKAKQIAGNKGLTLKQIINHALRIGLDSIEHHHTPTTFRTKPKPMGLKNNISLDNIADTLDQLDEWDKP